MDILGVLIFVSLGKSCIANTFSEIQYVRGHGALLRVPSQMTSLKYFLESRIPVKDPIDLERSPLALIGKHWLKCP
jgi:hypothetical protein